MKLFHYMYTSKEAIQNIVTSSERGFAPQVGGGEYGVGTYFAQHAVYPVAYGSGWLSGGIASERAASYRFSPLGQSGTGPVRTSARVVAANEATLLQNVPELQLVWQTGEARLAGGALGCSGCPPQGMPP